MCEGSFGGRVGRPKQLYLGQPNAQSALCGGDKFDSHRLENVALQLEEERTARTSFGDDEIVESALDPTLPLRLLKNMPHALFRCVEQDAFEGFSSAGRYILVAQSRSLQITFYPFVSADPQVVVLQADGFLPSSPWRLIETLSARLQNAGSATVELGDMLPKLASLLQHFRPDIYAQVTGRYVRYAPAEVDGLQLP